MPDRLTTLKSMLKASPTDEFLHFAIAKEYEKLDDLTLAEEYFLKLKELNIEYIGLYYHLAKLYEKQEKTELAIATYNDGITIGKKLNEFHALSELMNAKNNLELDL